MLYLIGLGVGDELDISFKGLEACKKSEVIYAETYTAKWQGSLEKLEKEIDKRIEVIQRKDMEEDSGKILNLSKQKNVSILIPGDPLTATTHVNLILDAKKEKIGYEIIHSSSILTAIAETGLNLYNFGKIATVVRPQKEYAPTSFYDAGVENHKLGMHTLFLLDVDMDTAEGIKILLGIEKTKKKGLFSKGSKVIAVSKIGTKNMKILYDDTGALIMKKLEPPAVLIVPGKLHFLEQEFLETF